MTPDAEAADDPTAQEERGQAFAAGLLGVLMVVGAVVVLVDAATLRGADGPVGPAAAPTLIGVLLGIVGGILAFQARRELRTGSDSVEPRRLWRLAALVGILIAFAVLLPILGYVVCSAGLFVGAALLLGAPHPGRVVAYGWTLAALVFILFDLLIGLTLPAGPWGF
jgi:putative tricarboxylic transport membrane protein